MIFENAAAWPTSFLLGGEILHGEISEDGKTLITGFANTVSIFDLSAQKLSSKFEVKGNINYVTFGENNTILTVTNKNIVISTSGTTHTEVPLPEEGTAVAGLAAGVFVGTKRGELLQIDLASKSVKKKQAISSSKITKLAVGNKKTLLAVGSSNGLLSIYDTSKGELVANDLKYHNMQIQTVAFNADDTKCLTGALEKDVHYWDLTKFQHIDRLESSL